MKVTKMQLQSQPDNSFDSIIATGLFDGADEAVTQSLAAGTSQQFIKKGTVLFIQGDEAKYVYIIHNGWIKLFNETLDGDEAIVDILTTGDYFGDSAMFGNQCYTFSAEVAEDVTATLIPIQQFRNIIEEHPVIAINMLSNMSRRRKQQDMELEHRTLQNAPQRIGCFMLRLCPEGVTKNILIHLPYDKTLVAARLGMQPETFSRALARLKKEAHIEVQGATVHISDLNELTTYSCSACSSSYPCE